MTPGDVRPEIVAERAAWIREMLAGIRSLPLASYEEFTADPRNPAAAESFLRRALEALLDLGRHVLAKRFALAPTEYKEIASGLVECRVLDSARGEKLREMAGFRNRMVHFYHRVTTEELYRICTQDVYDIESVLTAILDWTAGLAPESPSSG